MSAIKIGHGFDVHAFCDGNGFVLGGVSIPHNRAILAFSDGDVLIHALCDALLGALGLGDIGLHFPDTQADNKNRDSREFLKHIKLLLDEHDAILGNADLTIVAQSPKMASHLPAMKIKLAEDLQTSQAKINIKATTTEKLGYTGRGEGIAVHAVVLLEIAE